MKQILSLLTIFLITACINENISIASGSGAIKPDNIKKSIQYFGFAAIACDHDDPFDRVRKTDYSDEVTNFSNLNQVCVTADMEELKNRLRYTSNLYNIAFYVEPIFFEFGWPGGKLNPHTEILWNMISKTVRESAINTSEIIFYLVDEPTLRKLSIADVTIAAKMIKKDFPDSKIMIIEAYRTPAIPEIPNEIDMWGFNAYTILDPAKDNGYMAYLDLASSQLKPHQSLVLIMDGQHTPIHKKAGLNETDMAVVAENYFTMAKSRTDIEAILVYSWAGGIDNNKEKGVRDLPSNVIATYQKIGQEIIKK